MFDVAIFELFISPLTEPIMYLYVSHCLQVSTQGRSDMPQVRTRNKYGSKME